MSDMLDGIGDDLDDDGASRRRRSLWGLLVLACVAVIVACLMVLLGGSKGNGHKAAPAPQDTGNAVTVLPSSTPPGSAGSTGDSDDPAGASSSPGRSSSSSAAATDVHTGNPCPQQKSCSVDGDAGLIAAVNAYRSAHKRPPVDGVVSTNARTCALKRGGATCVPHYAWTSVPTQSAAAALKKFEGFSGAWMLDPAMTRLEVGWAWDGSGWSVAMLKSP